MRAGLPKCRQATSWWGAFALLFLMPCFSQAQDPESTSPQQHHAVFKKPTGTPVELSSMPLAFEKNEGQVNGKVRYLARGKGYLLFLTDNATVLSLQKNPHAASDKANFGTLRLKLVGARTRDPHATNQLRGTTNYFMGSNTANWHKNVPTFRRVEYDEVYPGVQLAYHGDGGSLEYDFVVKPHADATPIKMRFDGADRLRLTANGDLRVSLGNDNVIFHKPVLYQAGLSGVKDPVEGKFQILAQHTVTFQIGKYDRRRTLVIDPQLSYSSYLGGTNGGSSIASIAVDSTGALYALGETQCIDFPVTNNAFQKQDPAANSTPSPISSITITKFSPDFKTMVYSTYLGGTTRTNSSSSANDISSTIIVDDSGNAYVTGASYSIDFPVTAGALQAKNNGAANSTANAFLTKLSPDGSSLIFSTYLGGTGNPQYYKNTVFPNNIPGGDAGAGIALDSQENIFLSGIAYSGDFPVTSGVYQAQHLGAANGKPTGFIAKINPNGTKLLASTFFGGTGEDGAGLIALDTADNVYISGGTSSTDFPVTAGVVQQTNNGAAAGASNAFVAKLNPDLTQVLFSTYLGGSGDSTYAPTLIAGDVASGIVLDSGGNIYVSGITASNDFPVTNGAFQTTNLAYKSGITAHAGFVTKLNPTATSLLFSTYLTGNMITVLGAPVLDRNGDLFVSGYDLSNIFPVTADAYQSVNKAYHTITIAGKTLPSGSTNPILAEFASDGSLLYATYFGGSGYAPTGMTYLGDTGGPLAVDLIGNIYLAGQTQSSDFPITSSALQSHQPSSASDFVAKMTFASAPITSTTTTLTADTNPQIAGKAVQFSVHVESASNDVPTGSVVLSIDGKSVSTLSLNASGVATYSTSVLDVGDHTIMAEYGGDLLHSSSSENLTESITQPVAAPVKILVISGSNQSATQGTAFAAPLVARVTDASGNPLSGITVTFSGDGLSFSKASIATDASGNASTQATPTATGTFTATASVSGLTSTAVFSLIGTPVQSPTFAVALGSSSSLTVAQGKSGATTLTADAQAGYLGTISFSCPMLPAYATCGFSPTQVTLTSSQTSQSTTLTIATGVSQNGLLDPGNTSHSGPITFGCILFPGAFAGILCGRRKFSKQPYVTFWMGSFLACVVCGILLGCGGGDSHHNTGGGSEPTTNDTPIGQYIIPVKATGSDGRVSTINLTLNVQ